jgi:RNA polymerase sigma-70 factor, ECF subfamily
MAEAVLDCRVLPKRAVAREGVSFEHLVRKNQGMIGRLALAMLRDRDAANDVVQETFFRAFRHYQSFRSEAAFSTWTYRIAVNLCLDTMRRAGSRVVQPIEHGESEIAPALRDPDPGPEGKAIVRDLARYADAALEELTVNHRTILLLREVEGLSYAEIAEILRVPRGTVMSRLHHARRNLIKAFRRANRVRLPAEAPCGDSRARDR